MAVLNEADPYGLEPGTPEGAPKDEYEMEAVDLTRMLLKNGVVTTQEVERVWMRWFDESLAQRIGVPQLTRLVDRLNALVGGPR
ncbi:hypothetical protein C1N74_16300 (plasmid) [Microbacterium sp. SGAir0570]|nr:hypothetical protein C1N74_16300 [Microbacterium sp. SGAir0570]